ncbi:uncharacterized protein [Acropora muricata]|uniref:uncharacterized protein isoform X3 n=1 Tax=Acropora muricata TaxID=159855 RepID=UPI0034E563D6
MGIWILPTRTAEHGPYTSKKSRSVTSLRTATLTIKRSRTAEQFHTPKKSRSLTSLTTTLRSRPRKFNLRLLRSADHVTLPAEWRSFKQEARIL